MNTWTDEQNELWQLAMTEPPVASGEQTLRQAVNLAVSSFLHVCDFDGVEPPDREAVEARLREEFPSAFDALDTAA